MVDIIIEIFRAIVVAIICGYLVIAGKKDDKSNLDGWRYLIIGFHLLLFGMLIDITDNFEILNKFVVIGDTAIESFLEKIIGYLLGFVLVAIGFWKWLPSIDNLIIIKKELQRSELLLKETQSISKTGGWEYDVQTAVSTFTQAIFEIYGKTFSDSEEGIKYYHPDDRPLVSQKFENAISKGEPYDIEVRFINEQGENLWVRTVGKPVVENGKVVRILGYLMNITELKLNQKRLKKKKEKLELALNEVKVLSGLVPICSSCKKIRDDQGYWNILESYIQKHSDAQFSHGMCPECSDKFYGDKDWYINMKKKGRE